jgi:cyclin B
MKNISSKNCIISIQRGNDKRTINQNNDFLKKQLNKILFKKDSSNKERNIKPKKSHGNDNHKKMLQTRNLTNSNNNSKYISLRSNNSIDKLYNNDNRKFLKKEKLINKKFAKPNINLLDQMNLPANDMKLSVVLRSITQPYENKEIVPYKSCGKNNFDKSKNFNLKNELLNRDRIYLNNNNDNHKSLSKSPKRNYSSNAYRKNPGLISKLEFMNHNQNKQYMKLNEFYHKENELNKKYSLFNFPELKNSKSSTRSSIIKRNTQIPYEYFNEYLETYCREERTLEFKIKPNFMKNQKEINCRMRAIIVNWIIDVHDRFKLLPDTLFLSIIIFDRYMSIINNIDKNKLQLIGVTSLLIACKYEEIFSPEIRDFICILDREYEKEDLMEEENNILKILKFEVIYPSSYRYYEILRIEFGIEEKYYKYGNFLLELCLLDSKFSKYLQGVIATTVCFIVLKLVKNISFQKFMNHNIKIKEKEIMECLVDICFLIEYIDGSIYPSINKKYKGIGNEIKSIIANENNSRNT